MKKTNKSAPLFTIQCYEDRQMSTLIRKAEHPTLNDKESLEKRETTKKPPPPPPPMPTSNGHKNDENRNMVNHNQSIDEVDTMKIPNLRKVATLNRVPTPDYNNKTDLLFKGKKLRDENVEVESLESYKLKNPLNVTPRPPSNYFIKAPNGPSTMKKHTRPVSVTIGEYVHVGRKEPSKLEFLNGDKAEVHRISDDEPITSRLQSELALTLSRSNLRKKTEVLDPPASDRKLLILKVNSKDENFHARYGNNLLPLPPSITIPKVSKPNY